MSKDFKEIVERLNHILSFQWDDDVSSARNILKKVQEREAKNETNN